MERPSFLDIIVIQESFETFLSVAPSKRWKKMKKSIKNVLKADVRIVVHLQFGDCL